MLCVRVDLASPRRVRLQRRRKQRHPPGGISAHRLVQPLHLLPVRRGHPVVRDRLRVLVDTEEKTRFGTDPGVVGTGVFTQMT